ncbi:MAG: heme-binding protein [Phycisphaerae bacterium]
MLLVTLLAVAAGCASHHGKTAELPASVIYQTASTPSPSWVFGPSAPLPAGFPKPGPVGEIIIKQYPASRIAMVDRNQQHRGSGGLFMPLFRHIEKNHIAMSSPVVMTYRKSAQDKVVISSMAFVYPSEATGQLNAQGAVKVVDVPVMMVVSIGVRGGYNASRFLKASGKLYLWLAQHKSQFTAVGQARYLAYNSPFVPPPFQYGEVQIPVTPVRATGVEK